MVRDSQLGLWILKTSQCSETCMSGNQTDPGWVKLSHDLKTMIQAIMMLELAFASDVVYNHTFSTVDAWHSKQRFQTIITEWTAMKLPNGTGVGNETALQNTKNVLW